MTDVNRPPLPRDCSFLRAGSEGYWGLLRFVDLNAGDTPAFMGSGFTNLNKHGALHVAKGPSEARWVCFMQQVGPTVPPHAASFV